MTPPPPLNFTLRIKPSSEGGLGWFPSEPAAVCLQLEHNERFMQTRVIQDAFQGHEIISMCCGVKVYSQKRFTTETSTKHTFTLLLLILLYITTTRQRPPLPFLSYSEAFNHFDAVSFWRCATCMEDKEQFFWQQLLPSESDLKNSA